MTHSYDRKGGVEHSEILTPDNAPSWASDRQELWNRVDAGEKRKDARTAKEVLVALPRELTPAQQIELVREFARAEFVSKGMVVDFSIHAPDALDGEKQPHAHIMATTRALDGDGWAKGNKDRTLDHTDGIEAIRERWAQHTNRALERAGLGERVDHRSLADQKAAAIERGDEAAVIALDRPPEPKIGPVALQMIKTGREDQAHAWRDVKAVREHRSRLGQVVDFLKATRDLIQSRTERLASLGSRLERAMEGLKQRAATPAPKPPQAAPAPRRKLSDAEIEAAWERACELHMPLRREEAQREEAWARKAWVAADDEHVRVQKARPKEATGWKAWIPGARERFEEALQESWKREAEANKKRCDALGRYQELQGRAESRAAKAAAEDARKANPELARQHDEVRARKIAEVEAYNEAVLRRSREQSQSRGPETPSHSHGRGGRGGR